MYENGVSLTIERMRNPVTMIMRSKFELVMVECASSSSSL